MEIYVENNGDYPSCPLRSDLNSCKAVTSDINSCPQLNEDYDIWSVPDYCPLRKGGVLVQFEENKTI